MPCTSAVRAAGSTLDHAVEAGDVEAGRGAAARGRNRLEVRLGQPHRRAGRDRGVRRAQPVDGRRVLLPSHPVSRSRPHRLLTPKSGRRSGCAARGRSGRQSRERRPGGSPRCTTTPGPAKSRSAARSSAATGLGLGEHHGGLEPPRARGDRHRDAHPERGDAAARAGRRWRRRRCGRRGRGPRRPRRRRCGPGWRGPGSTSLLSSAERSRHASRLLLRRGRRVGLRARPG